MTLMFMNVMLDRVPTPINRGVFEALFEQSVVRSYAPITRNCQDLWIMISRK